MFKVNNKDTRTTLLASKVKSLHKLNQERETWQCRSIKTHKLNSHFYAMV